MNPIALLADPLLQAQLWNIVSLSLSVSASAVLLGALIGLPLGALIAVSQFKGRSALVVVLNSLMGTPTVIIGVLIYLLLSRSGPLGSLGFLFTPKAMVVAQTCLVFPLITAWTRQTAQDTLEPYQDLFNSLQLSSVKRAWLVMKDARLSYLVVIMAALGRALSEVGAVMIVGGNIEGVTRVMTTTIALETSKGNLTLALYLGAVLMLIILFINGLGALCKRRTEQQQ
ncbi:MAG: ABC transporter permease [Burkholderiales bacterium]|jgi:tungstate transport system permease protein|nr:ABC transporter permease [Burkholderiales bacterium]